MKLYLAPMEGVVDWVMRDVLTEIGGIDHCVTEFLRVTDRLLPDHIFYKNCPELNTQAKTRANTPVYIQLLGSDPDALAVNAERAIQLGAPGIDLNFGCPAKTVNRHDGGASLLKSSDRLFDIVSKVRQQVPKEFPVSAKIRLGFDQPESCLENAQAISEAGASWLTVHCRTKIDGYRPPAYWEWIPKIREQANLKLIANGEIWTVEDFKRCREVTGCEDFMIGRGMIANPFLFLQIQQYLKQEEQIQFSWATVSRYIPIFYQSCIAFHSENYAVTRTKQWLKQLAIHLPEAKIAFEETKVLTRHNDYYPALQKLLIINTSLTDNAAK